MDNNSIDPALRNDNPLLDHLSMDELEDMLTEAEDGIREIRLEMRERRAQIKAGIEQPSVDSMLPKHSLDEARGHWTEFFAFLRQVTRKGEDGATTVDVTETPTNSTAS